MDAEQLERRLFPPKAKGTKDEFWIVATRRRKLATEHAGAASEKQHLALAALFAGRGIAAHEDDLQRLTAYREMFERARAAACLPQPLHLVMQKIAKKLRDLTGTAPAVVLVKKAGRVPTTVGVYAICDATKHRTLTDQTEHWADEDAMRRTIGDGAALFVYAGSDGALPFEVRIVDSNDLSLSTREYKNLHASAPRAVLELASGRLRIAAPTNVSAGEVLELDVEPGSYAVAMYSIDDGNKCIVIATRALHAEPRYTPPKEAKRLGQSEPGLLDLQA